MHGTRQGIKIGPTIHNDDAMTFAPQQKRQKLSRRSISDDRDVDRF
jgi:hypothetical protein